MGYLQYGKNCFHSPVGVLSANAILLTGASFNGCKGVQSSQCLPWEWKCRNAIIRSVANRSSDAEHFVASVQFVFFGTVRQLISLQLPISAVG